VAFVKKHVFVTTNVLFLVGNCTLALIFSQSAILDPKTAHFCHKKAVSVFLKGRDQKMFGPLFSDSA
jgi:hypothetical protein